MAIQQFKVTLNQARFSLLSSDQSRPVLVPSIDTSGRQPRQYQGSNENIDFNIPQIIYGENFVPVSNGVASVSYRIKINPLPKIPALLPLDQVIPLRDAQENSALFSPSQGQNYIYRPDVNFWGSVTIEDILAAAPDFPRSLTLESDPTKSRVTRAYVNGMTFICYSRLVCEDAAFTPGGQQN